MGIASKRFSDWMNPTIGWDTPDRSVKLSVDEWIYSIDQPQPTEEEVEAAKERERARRNANDESEDSQSELKEAAD